MTCYLLMRTHSLLQDACFGFLMQFFTRYRRFIRVNLVRIITYNKKEEKTHARIFGIA